MSFNLERHHYEWIINGAYEHFAEKVQELEQRLAAHVHHKDVPFFHPKNPKAQDRAEQIADLERYLGEYRAILAYIVETLHELRQQNSEASAVEFGEFMRERHGLNKKATKKTPAKRAKR